MESPRKQPKREYNSKDRLTWLPDEILAQILSRLTLKDAVKSSVLSLKWRYLWKLASGFYFDVSKTPFNLYNNENKKISDESERMKLVNYLVGLDEFSSHDKFAVDFNLDEGVGHSIDEWIMSSVNIKRVKNLDICGVISRNSKPFSLSLEFQQKSDLTSISLKKVRINGGTLDYILSHCPHLEKLFIYRVRGCVNLKVCGPSLKLKVLQVKHCLPSIQLSAPKLEKFQYLAAGEKLCIGDNPLLSELFVGWLQKPLATSLLPFSSQFSQLRILYLYMSWEDTIEIPDLTGLVNLNHLTFNIRAAGCESLLGLTKFIETNPCLEKFTLMFGRILSYKWIERCREMRQEAEEESSSQTKTSRKKQLVQPHQCLKFVEMIGFSGSRNDYVLARYLIRNAVNLEKMLIDVKHPDFGRYFPEEIRKMRREIPKGVEILRKKLRPRAELEFKGIT